MGIWPLNRLGLTKLARLTKLTRLTRQKSIQHSAVSIQPRNCLELTKLAKFSKLTKLTKVTKLGKVSTLVAPEDDNGARKPGLRRAERVWVNDSHISLRGAPC